MNPVEKAAHALIQRFIAAVNARDAAVAQATLQPGAQLVFPGPTVFEKVSDFLQWTAPRYRSATYTYTELDVLQAHGVTLVYAQGFVDGEFPDGEPFRNVRYIDRFVLESNLIARKEVWTDMADLLRRLKR